MSFSSESKGEITCTRQFFTETVGKYIHTSEFYPQILRDNTMHIGCPQLNTLITCNKHCSCPGNDDWIGMRNTAARAVRGIDVDNYLSLITLVILSNDTHISNSPLGLNKPVFQMKCFFWPCKYCQKLQIQNHVLTNVFNSSSIWTWCTFFKLHTDLIKEPYNC